MSDLNYQPPAARVDEAVDVDSLPFYVVAPTKFTVLYFGTLGLYGIYWFYRHWAQFKRANGLKIWPVPRGIFNIFFAHSLFGEFDQALKREGQTFAWDAKSQATTYVVLSVAGYVINRVMGDSGWSIFVSIALLVALLFPLLKAQRAANHALNDAQGQGNSTFTAANIVWIVVGVLFWLLAIFGSVMMIINPELANG